MTGELNTSGALDVLLRGTWIGGTGYRYDVILGRETIVQRSRDPEHDAARVLHARGLRGRFRTIDFVTGGHRMTLDAARAAKLRVVERDDDGPPTVMPYRPLSEDVRALLGAHTSDRGGAVPGEVVQGTRQPPRAAGGETCADSARSLHGKPSQTILEEA